MLPNLSVLNANGSTGYFLSSPPLVTAPSMAIKEVEGFQSVIDYLQQSWLIECCILTLNLIANNLLSRFRSLCKCLFSKFYFTELSLTKFNETWKAFSSNLSHGIASYVSGSEHFLHYCFEFIFHFFPARKSIFLLQNFLRLSELHQTTTVIFIHIFFLWNDPIQQWTTSSNSANGRIVREALYLSWLVDYRQTDNDCQQVGGLKVTGNL